jgi:hypothetical protein
MIRYLTKDELIFVNKRTVARHGGQYILPYNFLNEGALDYLIDIVSSEMFFNMSKIANLFRYYRHLTDDIYNTA